MRERAAGGISTGRRPQRSQALLGQPNGVWRDALLRRALALADAAAALLATSSLVTLSGQSAGEALAAAVLLPAWVVLAKLHGLYDRDHRVLRHLTLDELPSLLVWAGTATAGSVIFLELAGFGAISVSSGVRMWLVASLGAISLRGLTRFAWRRLMPPERTVVVGSGPLARATRRKIELFPDIHARVVGEVDESAFDNLCADPGFLAVTDRIILASQSIDERLITTLVRLCRDHHVKLSVVPPARGLFGTAVQLRHVADLPVVEYNTWDASRSTLLLKRAIDIVVSLVALTASLPILLLIAAAIRVDSPGPILFVQMRAGHRGRPFRMRKFRTMVANAEELLGALVPLDNLEEPMFKLTRDPRVTRVGRMLRRTSLDELPQLWNVLKGEMSLVGPRPEQLDIVDRYEERHLFRLDVKPGLTGPMQVYGRGQLMFEERLAVEREYIENLSLGRDIRILAMTLSAVFSGKGAF